MAEKKADKQKFVEGREVISITVMLRQRCFVFEERNTGHEESQLHGSYAFDFLTFHDFP